MDLGESDHVIHDELIFFVGLYMDFDAWKLFEALLFSCRSKVRMSESVPPSTSASASNSIPVVQASTRSTSFNLNIKFHPSLSYRTLGNCNYSQNAGLTRRNEERSQMLRHTRCNGPSGSETASSEEKAVCSHPEIRLCAKGISEALLFTSTTNSYFRLNLSFQRRFMRL